jgi:hypothetical protein
VAVVTVDAAGVAGKSSASAAPPRAMQTRQEAILRRETPIFQPGTFPSKMVFTTITF